jgi:hypothetical protein
MTLGSGGISPQNNLNTFHNPGMGELGADESRGDKKFIGAVDDEEFDRLVESGEIERDFEGGDLQEPEPADVEAQAQAQNFDRDQEDEGEQGQPPMERKAPVKPTQDAVNKHNLTHIPRRMWCPICAKAMLEEDPHRRHEEDHREGGIPEVHMYYKELRKGQRPLMVMLVRGTGATFGLRCNKKGPDDNWAVKRCVEQTAEWGLTNVRLMIRSNAENAIKVFRQAMCSTRAGSTLVGTSPPETLSQMGWPSEQSRSSQDS